MNNLLEYRCITQDELLTDRLYLAIPALQAVE